jgi:hypothetical protein
MKPGKPQHRVTRTRVKDSKLLEFGGFRRPLWIRRVLVRAQEGQWPVQEHRPFYLGLGPELERRRQLKGPGPSVGLGAFPFPRPILQFLMAAFGERWKLRILSLSLDELYRDAGSTTEGANRFSRPRGDARG